MVDVAAAHRPWVNLEAGEVGHPCEMGDVANRKEFRGTAAREMHSDGAYPRRSFRRNTLLVEEIAFDSVRVAFQQRRTIEAAGECPGSNRKVVAHDVELGNPE